MLKSLKSNSYRFVVVLLLLLTFLTIDVGKVIPIYALADPQPEFDPVYETEIIRFSDYVNNTLTPEQQDIFYIMFGAYLVTQGAMSNYHLEDPYTTEDGVIGWLKSTGIQLYNTLVDQTAIMTPQVLIELGINNLIDYGLGIAQKAGLYQSYNDFRDHVDDVDIMLMPINKGIQLGVNSILAINGGLYEWQSEIPYEFENYWSYSAKTLEGQYESNYVSAVSNMLSPRHLCASHQNTSWIFNAVTGTFNGVDQFDLFIDTNDHFVKFHLPNDVTSYSNVQFVCWNNSRYEVQTSSVTINFNAIYYEPSWFTSYVDILDYVFRQDYQTSSGVGLISTNYYLPLIFNSQEFVQNIYIGTDWDHKSIFTPNMTLNFADDNIVNYLQLQNDYLFDLKGLINDLINNVDLFGAIINNFYNPDGTLNINPSLIKVSIDLPVASNEPALPVNLNDIAEYTDNEYIDVVKQRSLQASETIGEYVAFWHNCDSELVYAILGSFIVILIGAFIGKWGHS